MRDHLRVRERGMVHPHLAVRRPAPVLRMVERPAVKAPVAPAVRVLLQQMRPRALHLRQVGAQPEHRPQRVRLAPLVTHPAAHGQREGHAALVERRFDGRQVHRLARITRNGARMRAPEDRVRPRLQHPFQDLAHSVRGFRVHLRRVVESVHERDLLERARPRRQGKDQKSRPSLHLVTSRR